MAAVLTFWAYAAIHMTRKALSEVKPDLITLWTTGPTPYYDGPDAVKDATSFLSTLDAIFMFAYAAGLVFAGDVGDRINLRWLLSGCMCGSAILVTLFGLGPTFGVGPWFYAVIWTANGVMQSACWPAVVAVMGNWWGKGVRGAAMGLWSGNASAGNAISGIVCGALLHAGMSWETCMFVSGGTLFASGVLMFVALVPHPSEVGMLSVTQAVAAEARAAGDHKASLLDQSSLQAQHERHADAEQDELDDGVFVTGTSMGALIPARARVAPMSLESDAAAADGDTKPGDADTPQAAGICASLMLPGTIVFSLCYACLKAVNYTMFFVLPLYLSNSTSIDPSRADFYSSLYDVGGIAGSFLAGALTDMFSRRSPIVVAQLLCSVPLLVAFGLAVKTDAAIIGLSLGTGFLVGGAANLVSSVFAVEIAEQVTKTKGGGSKQALATVTGIIDGLASVGAGIVLQLAGVIPEAYLFDMLAPIAALSAVCLAPVFLRDMWTMCGCAASKR
jgi:OPA family glycerol-3-phosphate transporter-like MFS transporter 1/2